VLAVLVMCTTSFQETERAILIGKGWVSSFQGRTRASNRALRAKTLATVRAYCPDFTLRRVVGFRDRRLEGPLLSALLLNPSHSGLYVLSEPSGTFSIEELKAAVLDNLEPWMDSERERLQLRGRVRGSSTYDEIFQSVPRV